MIKVDPQFMPTNPQISSSYSYSQRMTLVAVSYTHDKIDPKFMPHNPHISFNFVGISRICLTLENLPEATARDFCKIQIFGPPTRPR